MKCRVYQHINLDDDKTHQSVREAWEHADDKDELKIELQGLERQFWLEREMMLFIGTSFSNLYTAVYTSA